MKIITDIIKSHVPHGEYPSYYHESQIEHMMAEYEQQWIAAREALSQPPGNDDQESFILDISKYMAETKYRSPIVGNQTATFEVDVSKVMEYIRSKYSLTPLPTPPTK